MTSRIFKKASEGGQTGFTLIEIVTALILIGILAAAAVAKYFDMQEEAARIKCQYGRGVLIEQLHKAFAISKLENNKNFDDQPTTEETINKVMASLDDGGCSNGGYGCPKLCPLHVAGSKDKRYTVSYGINEGSAEFRVHCNVEGHGATGTVSSAKVIDDPAKAQTLIEFLGGLVDAMASDGRLQGWLKDFFINKAGNMLDSESDQSWSVNYDGYHSMTAPVLVALQKANIQTDGVIWRMIYKPDGNDVNKGTLYLWAASVSKDDKKTILNGGTINPPDLYEYTARYDNGKVTPNTEAKNIGKGNIAKFDGRNYVYIDKKP